MNIVDFDFDPGLLRRFLHYPRELHAADRNWLSDPSEPQLLSHERPGEARWRNFMALDGEQICGRVTAIVNRALRDGNDRAYGQLGFFESVDDPAVARCLLQAAIQWLRNEFPHLGTVLAPMNFDTWHAYRFRTAGFDESTFFMEPYNAEYYPALLTAQGFEPAARYVTKSITEIPRLMLAWEPYHLQAIARGYKVRAFDQTRTSEEISLIYRMSLSIFRENLFFTEIPESDFRALYSGSVQRLEPQLLLFLLDPAGEPVGLSFSVPDLRQTGTVGMKTFGIMPRVRKEGAGAALAYAAYHRFQEMGFNRVNHCLMRTGNRADGFDGDIGHITREYTLYRRSLRT